MVLNSFLKKVFGSKGDRDIKKLNPVVDSINALEDNMKALGDEELRRLTEDFKARYEAGTSTDDLLPEAFAAVREAAWRTLKMRHFDVQLIGGHVLHKGKIAEMKTGEGKTLMATLPLYLNALTGKGAHLVTVNDYLAKRDARWMGPVYHALGMSVGIAQHDESFIYDPEYIEGDDAHYQLRPVGRAEAYRADITYGTNNEFGFDYLRDNMKFSLEEYSQRELHFAIVDEVDSILIDEARTPLIISGPTESSTELYYEIDRIIPGLKVEDHFTIDEKGKQVFFTDEGVEKIEGLLGIDNLYDPKNLDKLHHVNQSLRAHVLFERDVDYVVKEDQVIIVDEFTGRLMSGRRWSDGLHQAVEAKEGVTIENENQTLATITFQNYFRMYEKLAGMTGTADTEAGEFYDIYALEVVVIPTNKPMQRDDMPDLVYRTSAEKSNAIIEDIKESLAAGRPVLVGTITIEKSEELSGLLRKAKVKHEVLNAKQHEREADIVAQAGRLGSVTLSTNMAGRGTDIVLGGNPVYMAIDEAGQDESTDEYKDALARYTEQCSAEREKVLDLGGLYIVGTERHESRRIDNQLRGRSGRQGDPGASRFYVSLDDDLMRIFGSERIASIMGKLGMEEGEPIEHNLVSKAIENAQKKVEGHNFDMRKHLLEYDDVMNQQREVVYDYRRQILSEQGLKDMADEFTREVIDGIVDTHIDVKASPEEWDLQPLDENLYNVLGVHIDDSVKGELKSKDELTEFISNKAVSALTEKVSTIGDELFSQYERFMMLSTLDALWKDHLLSMDHLKAGIGLRGYGQKNPINEYKREGFEIFSAMIFTMKSEVIEKLFKVQIQINEVEENPQDLIPHEHPEQKMTLNRGDEPAKDEPRKQAPQRNVVKKVGRNDPCPCGSGKKYKRCCGAK